MEVFHFDLRMCYSVSILLQTHGIPSFCHVIDALVFGCSLRTLFFLFHHRRVIFRGTVIIVNICLHVILHRSIFFIDLADLLHFVDPDIHFISSYHAYHFKVWK